MTSIPPEQQPEYPDWSGPPGSPVPPASPASQAPPYPVRPPIPPGSPYTYGLPVEPLTPIAGYAVPFQPRYGYDPLISNDYGGWWQRAWAIVKAGWPQLASLQAIGVVVGLLLQVPLALYIAFSARSFVVDAGTGASAAPPDLTPVFGGLGLTLAAAFVEAIVAATITIASMHLGVAIAVGAQRSVGDAAKVALRRALPLLGWELAAGLVTVLFLCLCIVPALYPIAVFTVLPAVVAFERTGAVSRCFTLFNRSLGVAVGRVATIVGIGLAAGLVSSVIAQVIDSAVGMPGSFDISGGAADVSTGVLIGATIASTVIGAVIAAAVAVLTAPLILTTYADLRARVEPLNTQVLVREIGVGDS